MGASRWQAVHQACQGATRARLHILEHTPRARARLCVPGRCVQQVRAPPPHHHHQAAAGRGGTTSAPPVARRAFLLSHARDCVPHIRVACAATAHVCARGPPLPRQASICGVTPPHAAAVPPRTLPPRGGLGEESTCCSLRFACTTSALRPRGGGLARAAAAALGKTDPRLGLGGRSTTLRTQKVSSFE